MNRTTVHHQLHGYRKGHQLLSASLVLNDQDQDVVNRLSDLSGRLRPGELFDPYLTAYPLPSRAHYVIARTFQDLEAARSGCVLTRSLLVPMDVWVELENLDWLLAMLAQVQRSEEASPRDKPTGEGMPPKKVSDERVVDLVHALFLEDVRPIVVFDAPQADLIATRLLVALWPTLRRDFSLCTLALGPRRLGDRSFELVFAPLSVQSRFPGDDFLRIGVRGSLPSKTIHHLAAPIARRIFHSDEPSLTTTDVLSLLGEHELNDRAAVRMVLRWEELASRAQTKPTAVLGMLDILNARGGLGPQEWDRLLPVVSTAMDLATVCASPRESWDFLFALTAKVERSTAPAELVGKLGGAVRSLARAGPEDALTALNESTADVRALEAVLKDLGDGVAEASTFYALSEQLKRLDPDLLLHLVAASDHMSEALATGINTDASRWLDILVHFLGDTDDHLCHRVRRRLLSLVDDSVAAATIPSMLAEVTSTELADLAVELAGCGKFLSQPFNTAFADIARYSSSVDVVRDAVASRVHSADAEPFLLEIVEFTQSGLEWLLDLHDGTLAGRLLTALLVDVDAMDIHSLLSASAGAGRVVSTLRSALPTSASQIARILILDVIEAGDGLDVGFEVVSMLPAEERQSLETWLLREVLSAAPLGDARLANALAEFSTELTPHQLVAAATATSISTRRVSENLEALNAAPEDIRLGVVGVVDVLSQHLVERRWEELDEAAYRAWAAMLADSSAAKSECWIKATATAFGFALRHASYPVSPLVVVSFPTVYREFPKLKKLGLSSDLIPFSSYSWLRWKKPKDVRRELIDALVSAFFNSSWPPADLMVAAIAAGVGERVVIRVRRRLWGFRYLKKISKDTKRLDDEIRCRVLACLPDTV